MRFILIFAFDVEGLFMKKSFVLICMAMFFALFANAQDPAPVAPQITVTGLAETYIVNETANAVVSVLANDYIDQLCKVKYVIKKDGQPVANLAELGTVTYKVRLQGEEDFEGTITTAEGYLAPSVVFGGNTYTVEAFTLGIFDNSECVARNRPIEVNMVLANAGNFTIDIQVITATAAEENIQQVFTFTDCHGTVHADRVAVNTTDGEVIATQTLNVNVENAPVVYETPYLEFVNMNSNYEVGDTVRFSANLHSNSYSIDNICAIGYKITYWRNETASQVLNDATRNGSFTYSVRVTDDYTVSNQITRGQDTYEVVLDYEGTTYNVNAFTMGLLDSDCADRNRPIDYEMLFTKAGSYVFETSIYTCSNGGTALGSSFTAENCDNQIHFDRVAETCDNRTLIATQRDSIKISGNTIYTVNATVLGGHGTLQIENQADSTVYDSQSIIVNEGTNLNVRFMPDENYALDTVIVNGIMRYPSVGTQFIVDSVFPINNISENYIITAKFKDVRPYYDVHVEVVTAGGTVTPKDTSVVIYSDVTIRIAPNAGYEISQLEVDGNIIANFNLTELTFENITEDHNVSISFFPSSITDEAFANLNVYPNPSNGKFTVVCDEFDGDVTFQLFNVSGEVVNEKVVSNEQVVEFANELSAGTYFLRIISGDKVATRKVIIE